MKEKEINFGSIQLTRKCNNDCIICSNPHLDLDLDFVRIKQQIKDFIDLGINCIILTGGEPTLSSNLIQTIEYCNKKNIEIRIITNGRMLKDEEFCKKLKTAGLKDLNISFYSHIEKIFENLTQKKGSYNETLKGIQNAIDIIGIPSLNFVINSDNYRSLPYTFEFISKKFPEIEHFSINFIDFVGKAIQNPNLIPTYTESELYIHKLCNKIKSADKTFRIERVPLCYLQDFEKYNSEAIKLVTQQRFDILFLDDKQLISINLRSMKKEYLKNKDCNICVFDKMCPGICRKYLKAHNLNEISPIFDKNRYLKIEKEINNL